MMTCCKYGMAMVLPLLVSAGLHAQAPMVEGRVTPIIVIEQYTSDPAPAVPLPGAPAVERPAFVLNAFGNEQKGVVPKVITWVLSRLIYNEYAADPRCVMAPGTETAPVAPRATGCPVCELPTPSTDAACEISDSVLKNLENLTKAQKHLCLARELINDGEMTDAIIALKFVMMEAPGSRYALTAKSMLEQLATGEEATAKPIAKVTASERKVVGAIVSGAHQHRKSHTTLKIGIRAAASQCEEECEPVQPVEDWTLPLFFLEPLNYQIHIGVEMDTQPIFNELGHFLHRVTGVEIDVKTRRISFQGYELR